jgi:hypothetical protein
MVAAVAPAATFTLVGLKLHDEFAGNPVHAKVTVPAKPATPLTLTGVVTDPPDCTVSAVPPLPGCTSKPGMIAWFTAADELPLLPSPP